VLQRVAVCRSVLQWFAVCCRVLQKNKMPTVEGLNKAFKGEKVLQRVAACCSVLQCVVVCCSVLQCVVARCSVLQKDKIPTLEELNEVFKGEKVSQRVAACCSVLQCVAQG